MEGRNLLRYSFFLFFTVVLILFTLSNLPAPPSNETELLDSAAYSPCCTSKNRIQSKKLDFLQKPTNPTRRRHSADVPRHPLDPLTVTELNKVQKIIQKHDFFKNKAYALHSVVLEEPEKKVVLSWKKGHPLPPRKAAVVARASGASHVMTVDLGSGEVTRHETGHTSGYPTMTVEDMTSVTRAPLASADFNRTVVERGVDLVDLACLPISTGWFGNRLFFSLFFLGDVRILLILFKIS